MTETLVNLRAIELVLVATRVLLFWVLVNMMDTTARKHVDPISLS